MNIKSISIAVILLFLITGGSLYLYQNPVDFGGEFFTGVSKNEIKNVEEIRKKVSEQYSLEVETFDEFNQKVSQVENASTTVKSNLVGKISLNPDNNCLNCFGLDNGNQKILLSLNLSAVSPDSFYNIQNDDLVLIETDTFFDENGEAQTEVQNVVKVELNQNTNSPNDSQESQIILNQGDNSNNQNLSEENNFFEIDPGDFENVSYQEGFYKFLLDVDNSNIEVQIDGDF